MYTAITSDDSGMNYYVLCTDANAFLKQIIKSVTLIKAAGGLVKNNKEKYLFIFRNGKWDLPKGKLEKGEKVREGAVREVEEECGITVSKCGAKILSTYHVYSFKGDLVLKKTWWYKMKYKGKGKLKPQLEEGITDVRWLGRKHIADVTGNTFPSIIDVLHKKKLLTSMPAQLAE